MPAARLFASNRRKSCPLWRRRIGIANGLPVATKWSPRTPFSAARTASRSREGLASPSKGVELREKGVDSPPRQPDRASHAPVDQPRNAAHRFSRWRPKKAWRASNVVVHRIPPSRPAPRRRRTPACCIREASDEETPVVLVIGPPLASKSARSAAVLRQNRAMYRSSSIAASRALRQRKQARPLSHRTSSNPPRRLRNR